MKEAVFQISSDKTSSCLMELVSPNLRFITKVSTCLDRSRILRMALYTRYFMLWCPVTARSSTKHVNVTGLAVGIILESRSLNNLRSKCIVTQYAGLIICSCAFTDFPVRILPRPLGYSNTCRRPCVHINKIFMQII